MRRALPASLLLAWFVALPAHAQSGASAKARAESLFDRALALSKEGKHEEACPRFAESQRLDPAVGTLLYLADCYESTGKVASAWATFREAIGAAHAAGQAPREKIARERAAALEPKVPKLTVQVPLESRVPGLAVTLDGDALAPAAWAEPTPVDPGDHVVAATAPGLAGWRTTAKVELGASIVVRVPKLDPDGKAPPVVASAPPPPASTAPPPPTTRAEDPKPPPDPNANRRALGLTVGAFGAVSTLVGGYFGLRAFSKWSDAKSHCSGARCDDEAASLSRASRTSGNLSNAFLGLGIVGLGVGATLYLTSPPPKSGRAVWMSPVVSQNGAAVAVGGAL